MRKAVQFAYFSMDPLPIQAFLRTAPAVGGWPWLIQAKPGNRETR